MPIYEYECTQCGHHLEIFQKASDQPEVICPECNRSSLQKLVSATSFQLKGTGWYQTDFRGGNKPAENKQSSTTETKPPKTDTKEK